MKSRPLKILAATLFAFIAISVISGIYCGRVAQRAARSAGCASNMKAICLSGRLWANERVELMPTNFMCMSNEIITPKVLRCPADNARPRVNTWEEFSEEKSSYLMVSPGANEGTTNVVFIRCRIHGHLGFADGSLRNANRTKVLHKY